MERFKTLPGVLTDAEGNTPKLAEELSIVIGLAAERVKGTLEHDEATLYNILRRLSVVSAVVIVVAAIVGAWWVVSRDVPNGLLWVIGGAALALGAVGLFSVFAPRTERFGVQAEHAAVTRVGLLYWPIGILPLSAERSVLWDPLTGADARLNVIDLPPNLGLSQGATIQASDDPQAAFAALLDYAQKLDELRIRPLQWPGNEPDSSAQSLAQELAKLWDEMLPMEQAELAAAIRFPQDELQSEWEAVDEAGTHLHRFHSQMATLREHVERYRERAEEMVDASREVVTGYRTQSVERVQDDRAARFTLDDSLEANGQRALPTAPSAHLLVTPATSVAQVEGSLSSLQEALVPLDQAIGTELARFEQEENAQLATAERRFAETRRALADDKLLLDTIDSDILTLATALDTQQRTIGELATQIRHGFEGIANVPITELQRQLDDLYQAMLGATALIDDVNAKIELPSVEQTLVDLREVTAIAHAQWERLATSIPARSEEVGARVQAIAEEMERLTAPSTVIVAGEAPSQAPADDARLRTVQGYVRDIERVARTVVSWTASQQDPLTPIEDKEDELADHLNALRDQRAKLEQASATLAALSDADSGRSVTLPAMLDEVATALARFIRLAEATTDSVSALHHAADSVRQQAEQIAQLLTERNELREDYQRKLADFQRQEAEERAQIRDEWERQRDQLRHRRRRLDRVLDSTQERLNHARALPDLSGAGVIMDESSVVWPDRLLKQMADAIEEWGKRVAGVDGDPASGVTQVERVRHDLEECYDELRARAVPTTLDPAAYPLEPQLCFVPFWYVETEKKPGEEGKNAGRVVHIFPPIDLFQRNPTETPRIEALRYEEVARRLLSYLRQDYASDQPPLESMSFDAAALTEAARRLDLEAAAPPLHEVAAALAQNWVFFRSTDPVLNRIIINSRDQLVPEAQMVEARTQGPRQPAIAPTPDRTPLPPANNDDEG